MFLLPHICANVDGILIAWGGLDTLIVCAGVSAIRPLLEIAGLNKPSSKQSTEQASTENIQKTVDIVNTATKVNFMGPLVSAIAFVRLNHAVSHLR